MKHPIHLLVPLSGQGTRYKKAGYTQPKPMIPVSGTPMIERLLEVFPKQWPAHFVMAENHLKTGLKELLLRLRPEAIVTTIGKHAEGPGRACEAALDQIPDEAPVLVSYCDLGMIWSASDFEELVRSTNCDACLISYRGFHAHYLNPVTYAYSRMEGDRVVEVKEKGSFTTNRQNEFASGGVYYFRTAKLLRETLKYQREINLQLNGEFYTSLTVEALLRKNPKANVRVFEIPYFFQWGTPEDLRDFEYWEATYKAHYTQQKRGKVAQVLMPMAGLGSRFTKISDQPKPLITWDDRPMFRHAVETLPQADTSIFVTLESFAKEIEKAAPAKSQFVALKETPSGQALSTEKGVSKLLPGKEVFVSSCDHGLVLDMARWNEFQKNPKCDAAIFTIKGYPGVGRTPSSYAYVVTEKGRETFAQIVSLSVKKPISPDPRQDALLVGSFWFRTTEILARAITLLKEKDLRVNGELYLDSVFTLLIQAGHRVRNFPLSGYLGWGDPDALSEARYWEDVFSGRLERFQQNQLKRTA